MRSRNGTSYRTERIGNVIKRAVSVIIETELNDPRIQGVTVLDVEVTHNLRLATVFVKVDGDQKQTLAALEGSAGYIRRVMCEELCEMRAIPQLRFVVDNTQAYYEHIESIIKGLHNEKDGNENN